MNVHWTESALADLQAAEAYIASHSPRFAQGIVNRIFARSGQLEAHPRLGAIVPDYDDEALRELFEDPYRIGEDRVDVVAVVHAARLLPADCSRSATHVVGISEWERIGA